MNNLKGIIGAIICGIIASLPWLFVWIYMGWIMSLLAIPIALGAEWGYKKMGGQPSNNLGLIIGGITILIVLLQVFIIIPLLLLNQVPGMSANFSTLIDLYQNTHLLNNTIGDAMISIVFAGIGIVGVVKGINTNYSSESTFSVNKRRNALKQEQNTNAIMDIFNKHQAYEPESAIDLNHEDFEWLFSEDYTIKDTFNRLKRNGIIKKETNKYYISRI